MSNKNYLVTNRSASRVFYAVPELGIKGRDFQPGETKRISHEELEGLSYIPGGLNLIREYLLIQDEEAKKDFVGKTEPEYNMTAAEVKELILHGSYDEWLDCLDFAPQGVLDLVQTLSLEIPLTDTRKMEAFQKKTGINLARGIEAKREEKAEMEAAAAAPETPQRRTKVEESKEEAAPQRRTTGSKYNVVKKG